jgi:lipoate-protein ligase B
VLSSQGIQAHFSPIKIFNIYVENKKCFVVIMRVHCYISFAGYSYFLAEYVQHFQPIACCSRMQDLNLQLLQQRQRQNTMATAADIRKAAQRVQDGTDVISTILKMKKETTEAIKNGKMNELKKAGYKFFSFNASTL